MAGKTRAVAANADGFSKMDAGRRQVLAGSAALLAATLFAGFAALASRQVRPNIISVVAADLGWKDVGRHCSDIGTPNIDRLPATGMRMEEFCAQPPFTPTPAARMTGAIRCAVALRPE